MNAKRSLYNVFWGLISQVVSILMGIIIPRLVIVSLGSEANGLLSSVNQALVYLNLLEAGIGTATLQALYTPIALRNRDEINRVLAATNKYYKKVGSWYFIAVCALAILYPLIIESALPMYTVVSVIFFSGMSQVVNFFFQGKYRILLQAEGKSYVLTNLGTILNICTSACKIAMLLLGFDVTALQIMFFTFSVVQMLYICCYIKKHYKWLDLSVSPNEESLSQRNAVMVHQISGLIFSNTDVLILTLFCGLKVVSVYSMYVMLFGMIGTVISIINGSFSFALGQTYGTDKEKFMKLYNVFETYNMALTFSLYSIAVSCILPFLRLYTEGVTDVNYIDTVLPYLFVATYLLSNGRSASQRVIEYAGHFKLTQNRSVIESVINITVSLVSAHFWGIYGVLFGTIAALMYRTNDMILYASKNLLKRSARITYTKWISNALVFIGVTVVMSALIRNINLESYGIIIAFAALACIIVVPLFFIVSSIIDKESFAFCFSFVKNKLSQTRSNK